MFKGPQRRAVLTLLAAACFGAAPAGLLAALGPPLGAHADLRRSSDVHQVAVFGSDDRRDIPPAYQSLARKIGVLTDQRTRSQCTAFCLSETVIATAAHCLYRTRDETRPDLRDFRFTLHGRPAASAARIAGAGSQASVAHVASGTFSVSIRPPIDATRDWALVKLDAPACTAGGLPLSQRSAEDLSTLPEHQPLYQVGYHRDFPGERLAFASPCLVSRSFDHASWTAISTDFDGANQVILHSCDTGGASSGSPLLIDGPEGPEVAGINVGTYVQSRILTVNGTVAHRYQSESIANTGVSASAFAGALDHFGRAVFLTARTDMRELQSHLAAAGVFSGPRDGLYGASSRSAIEMYERLEGRPVTGLATVELLQSLRRMTVAKAKPPQTISKGKIETGSVRALGITSSAQSTPARKQP